jgi:predicted nucleic acid-binding protein
LSELVVDASAFVKVLVPEAGTEQAFKLLERGDPLCAPAHMLVETANALWKKVRWQGLPHADASDALDVAMRYQIDLVPTEGLLPEAFALACELPHPVYDCLYLLLALRGGRTLVTADARMREAAGALGVRVEWVGA